MGDPNFPPGTKVRIIEHAPVAFTDPNAVGSTHVPRLGWVDANAPDEFLARGPVLAGTEATVADLEANDTDWPFHDEQGGGFFLTVEGHPDALIPARASFVTKMSDREQPSAPHPKRKPRRGRKPA